MVEVYCETDHDVCRRLWEDLIPQEQITDLWDVRDCFNRHFRREELFVTALEKNIPVGLIPLSYMSENRYYGYFPGEAWQGKTWLEQNRVIAPDRETLQCMLEWMDCNEKKYYLRYLKDDALFGSQTAEVDEIGYTFDPDTAGSDMENYYARFSGKSLRKIKRDINELHGRGLVLRRGDQDDFDLMVQMSLERFGDNSYFSDERFYSSFRDLRDYLSEKGWLKMTTVLIGGKEAAVDMGCVYNGVYTLLAGGTHKDYPGVAKAINLHHMESACAEGYERVDFLCGDFSWKKLFHLTPDPLYKLNNAV